MNLNYEDWYKSTYQHCDDPTEHDEEKEYTEDDVELTRSFTRKVLQPDADISKESKEVQGICNAVWTDEIKKTYKDFTDSHNA